MMDNKLLVTIDGGNSVYINVYDIIDRTDIDKKYIVYDIDGINNDDVCISILEETEDSFTLKTIENEEEMKEVEKYLEQYSNMGDE